MKTLTYGTLPSETEFVTAFNNVTPHEFDLCLNDSDFRMFEACGLTDSAPCMSVDGKLTYRYDAEQLYALCEALCQEADRPGEISAEGEDSWAGTFCSDILSALGFIWI